jgi:HK97 family phage major capsid protein
VGKTLVELTTDINAALKKVDEFWTGVPEGEERNVPREKREEIKGLNDRIAEWKQEANELKEVTDLRGANDAVKAWLGQSAGNMRHSAAVTGEVLSADAANAQFRGPLSIGNAFTGNDAFKAWHGMVAPAGREPSKDTSIQSPPVPLPDLTINALKTLVTSNTTGAGIYTNTTGGALVQPQFLPMVSLPFRPLKLRDVVTVIRADSPVMNYPKVTGYTNAAVEVAEATNTSSGLKPESALALALGTSVAATIPHWMPITRQALADAPQLRDLIDQFLLNGLAQRLEDEMISGNGTPPNMQGIHGTSGLSTQAFVTDNLTTLRKSLTKARISPIFVEPSAYLMNPVDAEGLDLATDNEARFYMGGPASSNNGRLWNKPVIESHAVPAGTVYTGDFSTAVLADLMAAQMFVFDQHSDWGLRNILAILAELRAHFFLLRPAAIVEITLGSW